MTESRYTTQAFISTACLVGALIASPANADIVWAGAVYPNPTQTTTNSDDLIVGYNTRGSLTINNGSVVNDYYGYMSYFPKAQSVATIDGLGSEWNHGRNFQIGQRGNAELFIQNGGNVNARYTTVGHESGSQAVVTLDGPGSELHSTSNVAVGYRGTGSVIVKNEATITSRDVLISQYPGAVGSLIVEGEGSSVNASVTIGGPQFKYGTAQMIVRDSGRVASARGGLYGSSRTSSDVLIDGIGSEWVIAQDLRMTSGFAGGDAKIRVQNGGLLKNGSAAQIGGASPALVELAGTDSRWEAGVISLGYGGSGTILVEQGASLHTTSIYSSFNNGGDAVLTVDGSGSLLSLSQDLRLDSTVGPTELSILDDAQVNVAGDVKIGSLTTVRIGLNTSRTNAPIMVSGSSTLGGKLEIEIDHGVTIHAGQTFPLIDSLGFASGGTFDGLSEGDIVDTINDTAFQITYTGGNGNDVWLTALDAAAVAPVPEPASALSLCAMAVLTLNRRRRC